MEPIATEQLPETLTPQELEDCPIYTTTLWPESSVVESLPGPSTKVWHNVHIREGAEVGDHCTIGDGVYIDTGVIVKDKCKIGNGAQLFSAALVGEGCFIGPGVMLLNDKRPRAVDEQGEVIQEDGWKKDSVEIGAGSSIGAGSIIAPGIKIGTNARVGMGSRVNKDIPDGGKWKGDELVCPTLDEWAHDVISRSRLRHAVDEKDYSRVISLAQELLSND
jgi:UDP-2-acetamido-3-amino-2,3-dideoxy-glucuronate N-acetyltransferase